MHDMRESHLNAVRKEMERTSLVLAGFRHDAERYRNSLIRMVQRNPENERMREEADDLYQRWCRFTQEHVEPMIAANQALHVAWRTLGDPTAEFFRRWNSRKGGA